MIRAVANIVDSPGGALFLAAPDGAGAGGMSWAGSSSMAAAVTDFPASHPLLAAFRAGQSVLVLRDAPELVDGHPVLANAWLAVKLPRSLPAEETLGFVLLKPPRASFTLDAEVFALLTVVARQVAAAVTAQQAAETPQIEMPEANNSWSGSLARGGSDRRISLRAFSGPKA